MAAAAAEAGINLEELEVVKVTVDRREKRLQDYAGAASVFTEHDMERTGVHSLRTMSDVSPFVHIAVQEGNTEVYIRGIGSDNNTELGDPAAATHIDGVYIPRPRGVGALYFDLERVEIGRGPQGTLRGRNATSGSINIVTAKPKLKEWGAEASVQFGNYSQKLTRAMVNIPLGDTLALRVATFTENHDPFYTNAGPIDTIQASESADTLAYRVNLKWAPAQAVTLNVGHDFMQEKGTGYGGTNFSPALKAGIMPTEIRDPRKVIYRGPQGREDTWHLGAHADLVIDAGPVLIQYLGSYRQLEYRQVTPGNAGIWYPGVDTTADLDNWSHSRWHQNSQSTVQELRIFAPDTSRFRWNVGGFAFYEWQKAFLGQISDQANWYSGGEFTMPDVKGLSVAGYVDGTFDITKNFKATAGIRVTSEEKSRTGLATGYSFPDKQGWGNFRFGTEGFDYVGFDRTMMPTKADIAANQSSDPNACSKNGGATGCVPDPQFAKFATEVMQNGVARWGARDTMLAQYQKYLAPNSGNGGEPTITPQDGRYKETFIDWRAGLEYDLTPANLLYGMVSTGHHSGGFNDTLKSSSGNYISPEYKAESILAFELGSKNEFWDRKARLNVALFDYEYTNQQFQTVVPVEGTENLGANQTPFVAAVRQNAANSRILGAEIDAQVQLPFGLVGTLQALLEDAKFLAGSKVFDSRLNWGSSNEADKVSLEGKWLPKTSPAVLNYSLAQTIKTSVGYFDWIVSAQTRMKYYLSVFNGEGYDLAGNANTLLNDAVPTYTRLDIGVGHTRPDGKLRFDAFMNNVTDVWYTNSLINVPNLNLRFVNPPRQFGVRMTVYL